MIVVGAMITDVVSVSVVRVDTAVSDAVLVVVDAVAVVVVALLIMILLFLLLLL